MESLKWPFGILKGSSEIPKKAKLIKAFSRIVKRVLKVDHWKPRDFI